VVVIIIGYLLVSVCFCGCGVLRSGEKSDEATGSQSQTIPESLTPSESPAPSGSPLPSASPSPFESPSTSGSSPTFPESPSPSVSPTPSGSPDAGQSVDENSESSSSITVDTFTQGSSGQSASSVKLGVYGSDPSVGQPLALQVIDWSAYGSLMPGQSVNSAKVYLRNEGNVPVTLSLSAADWVFRNSAGVSLSQSYKQYFGLSWDYDNSELGVNETVAVTFTLAISASIVNVATFSFRLVVTATY
jgi:hypothetical protein